MLIREAVQCPEEGVNLGKLRGFQGPPVPTGTKAESVILLLFLFSEKEWAITIPGLRSKMLAFDIFKMRELVTL